MRKTISFDPKWFDDAKYVEETDESSNKAVAPRYRATVRYSDLDHIRRDRFDPWPEFRADPEPREPAASKFTIRLSKRDRKRLEAIRAKLGVATFNQTIQAMIRATYRGYVEGIEIKFF
jgi:hypothetical protein